MLLSTRRKIRIEIPMIINSETIKPGDHLKVPKKSESVEEPRNKKFKFTPPGRSGKTKK